MSNPLIKIIYSLIIILSINSAHASIIQVSFSGTIDNNYFDVPVGTIVSAGFSYNTDSPLQIVLYEEGFSVFDVYLTMMGKTVTNHFGFVYVNEDSLELQSGPSLLGGGSTYFSDLINSIEIRGIGFSIDGSFTADTIPSSGDAIYGSSGTFFVNRSQGQLYDVNSPHLLQIPKSPSIDPFSVSEPKKLFALILTALVLFSRRHAKTYIV